ncbi:MAG: hypothetical protein QNJ51_26010 [Calothrix sp. MO_167.B12]|nr:hypothetical protein [Calothrix sp. MO_167.B12]
MKSLQNNTVWIAIGLVISGVVGTVGVFSWLDGYINQRISNSKIVLVEIKTKECSDPRPGKANICKCDNGNVQLGLNHLDVKGDDKNTEQIVSIICGKPSLVR